MKYRRCMCDHALSGARRRFRLQPDWNKGHKHAIIDFPSVACLQPLCLNCMPTGPVVQSNHPYEQKDGQRNKNRGIKKSEMGHFKYIRSNICSEAEMSRRL